MPYTVEWAVEPIIRLSRFSGVVTADEVESWIRNEMVVTAAQMPNIVHTIVDMTEMERITASIMKMPITFQSLQQPNLGWFAIIGTTPLVSFWLQMLNRMAGLRFRLFLDVEEATEFLKTVHRLAQESSSG